MDKTVFILQLCAEMVGGIISSSIENKEAILL